MIGSLEMKKILCCLLMALAALVASAQRIADGGVVDTVYTVHSINQDRFKDVIADWEAHEWNMRSQHPVVVDFYADWCQPCRRLAPILREIAQDYNGEVDFYRINVDNNPDIAAAFEIRSIPMLLICPLDGEPKTLVGLYSKQEYIRIINQALER
jgi:thioredoxin